MRRSSTRCDLILALIDECLGDEEGDTGSRAHRRDHAPSTGQPQTVVAQ